MFETKQLSPGEFIDRFTILILKNFHSKDEKYKQKLDDFVMTLDKNGLNGKLIKEICELQMLNTDIWITEDDIREKKEAEVSMVQVAKQALRVRDRNSIRLLRFNDISKLLGEDNQEDIKIGYASNKKVEALK